MHTEHAELIAVLRRENERLTIKVAELSALQRQQELQRWLESHFSEREQMRVRALLGV